MIDALVELIQEGDLEPGAKQIAERAGVSHRSIFRYFDDTTDLAETAARREFAAAAQLAGVPDAAKRAMAARIGALVDSRLVSYRKVENATRVARHHAARYPRINDEMTTLAIVLRAELLDYFGPELTDADRPTQTAIADAMMTLTSFDAWDLARRVYRDEQIRRSRSTALDVLLCNAAARGQR